MISKPSLSRRTFLKAVTLSSGAFVLGVSALPMANSAHATSSSSIQNPKAWNANLYLQIHPDGRIVIQSKNPECGQGIKTTLPMVVAEYLNANWQDVQVEQAAVDVKYGRQMAAASLSTADGWDDLRIAGAAACKMLLGAAAELWQIDVSRCYAENSKIIDKVTQKSLSYGELAVHAAKQPIPEIPAISLNKKAKDFKLLGKFILGVDNQKIITGQPLFGVDTRVDGMLYAVFEKCPQFGGQVKKANIELLQRLPGITHAFIINREASASLSDLQSGVAIVAESWWQANSARKQLVVEWTGGSKDSTEAFKIKAEQLLQTSGSTRKEQGDVEQAFNTANKIIESTYYYPFTSHTTMEPQNCTASYDESNKRLTVWAPSQDPQKGQKAISKALGIPLNNIEIKLTRMGGGFGRRLLADFMLEASAISQKIKQPVQLIWTRENDMQHSFYRPAGWHNFKAGLDKNGDVIAWAHHFVTFGENGQTIPGAHFSPNQYPVGFIPNYRLSMSLMPAEVPTGPWRSPGHSAYAWAFQSFFDELALAANQDPLTFRLNLLNQKHGKLPLDPARARQVLNKVADNSAWHGEPKPNQYKGIAFHSDHDAYTAEVAVVSLIDKKTVKIEKIYSVTDVGSVLNKSGAEQQVQGCIINAISAMNEEATFKNGATVQSNFHDYPIIRMDKVPEIAVDYVENDTQPVGIGLSPIAPATPAITNAIFAATGIRIKTLPLDASGITVI